MDIFNRVKLLVGDQTMEQIQNKRVIILALVAWGHGALKVWCVQESSTSPLWIATGWQSRM